MNGGFGDDVGVEAVAKINRVDVVAVQNISFSPIIRHPRASCGAKFKLYLDEMIFDLPFQIAVHYGEKDLQEEVDGVYQHRQ